MRKLLLLGLIPFFGIAQTQIGTSINGLAAGDNFGSSVALSADGTVLAVGANLSAGNGTDSGQVRVFKNIGGTWTIIGEVLNGSVAGDNAGLSVALSSDGNILAVGSPHNQSFSGQVRIYQNISGSWTAIGNAIQGTDFGDNAGWSVSLSSDGNVVAIGAIGMHTEGFETGGAKVYRNISGVWTQVGGNLSDTINSKSFGRVVKLSSDGNTLALSQPFTTINGAYSGRVNIYENIAGVWTQKGNPIDGTFANGTFGYAVDLSSDGSVVAIGGSGNGPGGSNTGLVRVYKFVSGTWTLLGNALNGIGTNMSLGHSIGLSADGTVLAVGSNNFQSDFTNPGRVQLFVFQSGNWVQKGSNIEGANGELLGMPLALSADGNTVATGAIYNSDNGQSAGQAKVFDFTNALATEDFTQESFAVYPNPASDNLAVSLSDSFQLKQLSLYNPLGQLIGNSSENNISVNGLAKGVYFLQVITQKGKAVKQILVN